MCEACQIINSWNSTSGVRGSGPEHQNRANFGPIPEGDYFVNPNKIDYYNWWDPRDRDWRGSNARDSWGNARVPIEKAPSNTTTRGGCFIHGGKNPGSYGCIDLTCQEKPFFDVLERYNKPLPLTVKYN